MLPIIKLRRPLHKADGQSASVVSVISIDQIHQQKEEFEAFCLKLKDELEARNCYKITIIETGYLKRYYLRLDTQYSSFEDADKAAMQLGKKWIEENRSALDILPQNVLEIISWKDVLQDIKSDEDKAFNEYLSIIKKDYESDKHFKNLVDKLAQKYADKLTEKCNKDEKQSLKCLEAAKDYLFEESSIIFKLVHHGFTHQIYPGAGNAALRYIYRKHFGKVNPLPWIQYDILSPCTINKAAQLKCSTSPFFQSASNKDKSCETIMEQITSLFNKLPEKERAVFIEKLYKESRTETMENQK